jgi:ABC-2 type transporter
MSVDDRTIEDEKLGIARVDLLVKSWKTVVETNGDKEFDTGKDNEAVLEGKDGVVAVTTGNGKKRRYASLLSQTFILTRRNWTNLLRDDLMLKGNLLECLLVGFFFGLIFFRLGSNLTDVLTRKAALYIVASIQTYLQLIFSIYKACAELQVFDRERSDKIYSVLPFVCAQFIAQLPFNILFPTLYSVISYFVIGLRTDDLIIRLFRFILANVLSHLVVYAFSLFAVSIARDFATSSLLANGMFTFFRYLDILTKLFSWVLYSA